MSFKTIVQYSSRRHGMAHAHRLTVMRSVAQSGIIAFGMPRLTSVDNCPSGLLVWTNDVADLILRLICGII